MLPAGVHSGLKDGGVVDRIGLAAWRQRRRQQQSRGHHGRRLPACLVHIIERSSPFSGSDDPEAAGESGIHVVRCPKSGVNFFDLGDFSSQFEEARGRALQQLEQYQGLLSSLPQQQPSKQQLAAPNNAPAPTAVVLPGALGAAVSSSAGPTPSLVVAATRAGSGPANGTAAAVAAAGLTATRQVFAPPPRSSSVRRAVQEDSC